ncbi:MAG: GntR family transcriptional regulator [Bryobacteraceae bacterium]
MTKLPFRKLTLSSQILRSLRVRILTGRYAANSWLREEELAREYSVSRNMVRLALAALEAEGLVAGSVFQGRKVVSVALEEFDYLQSARIVFECRAVEKAIRNLTDEHVTAFRKIARQLRDPELTLDEFFDLDLALHEFIWEAAGDHRLERLCRLVVYPFLALSFQEDSAHGLHQEDLRQEAESRPEGHQLLIEAICGKRTEEARELMVRHITFAYVSPIDMKRISEEVKLASGARFS